MLKILIYGDGTDKDRLTSMLDRATPIYYRLKEYVYCDKYDDYMKAMKENQPELLIVTADGEPGYKAVKNAYETAPSVKRMWFSDRKDYLPDSYELGCTWFTPKPLTEEILTHALMRYNGVGAITSKILQRPNQEA